jgi:hypothetical protein
MKFLVLTERQKIFSFYSSSYYLYNSSLAYKLEAREPLVTLTEGIIWHACQLLYPKYSKFGTSVLPRELATTTIPNTIDSPQGLC